MLSRVPTDIEQDAPPPRLCHLFEWDNYGDGYGFVLEYDDSLHWYRISEVDHCSPAEHGGLRVGDIVIEINGVNIANATSHWEVAHRVKAEETRLLVIDQIGAQWYASRKYYLSSSQRNIQYCATPMHGPSKFSVYNERETAKHWNKQKLELGYPHRYYFVNIENDLGIPPQSDSSDHNGQNVDKKCLSAADIAEAVSLSKSLSEAGGLWLDYQMHGKLPMFPDKHNTDPETALHNPTAINPPPVVDAEDFNFRPWFLSPWFRMGIPHMPHQQSQEVAETLNNQQNRDPETDLRNPTAVNPPPVVDAEDFNFRPWFLSPWFQTGIPHMPHQQSQEVAETLNNQVAPRTRANNFLDDFCSCSRQNLLSVSSNNYIKSNQSVRVQSTSQIRPVAPLSSNTVSWNQRAPVYDHTPDSSTSTYHAVDRSVGHLPPSSSEPVLGTIISEASKLLVCNSLPPDSLMELFQELGNLRSDGLERALSAVKELARIEKTEHPSATAVAASANEYKSKSVTKEQEQKAQDSLDQEPDSSQGSIDVPDGQDSDEPNVKRMNVGSHWNSGVQTRVQNRQARSKFKFTSNSDATLYSAHEVSGSNSGSDRKATKAKHCGDFEEILNFDAALYRHIVGKHGKNIKKISKNAGVTLKIPVSSEKSDAIAIKGSSDGIQQAKTMIQELIDQMEPCVQSERFQNEFQATVQRYSTLQKEPCVQSERFQNEVQATVQRYSTLQKEPRVQSERFQNEFQATVQRYSTLQKVPYHQMPSDVCATPCKKSRRKKSRRKNSPRFSG